MFHVYWTYVHMQHASMCLNIMVLYFNMFLGKISFPIEKFKFDKIHVLVFGKNDKTQKWFHMLDI